MTNTMKRLEEVLEELEVPFEQATHALTLDKPFYPKVLYYKSLEDAMLVYEHCENNSQVEPNEHDQAEMKMTISQIIRKRQNTDPWY